MARNPRYDVLFEPVPIGPVTAPNRFYQVPHCTGMGSTSPQTLNRMRETKAEGGWGVVNTEYCSIHPSSDDQPYPYCTLWDDDDVRNHAAMTEMVHRHGALAGVELWYGGGSSGNNLTRAVPLGLSSMPTWLGIGQQTQPMSKRDIREVRGWHRDAALRAKRAGFDIVYVHASAGYLPVLFLSRVHNQRTDEYGGSFENRVRLLRELLEDTKEAVGDTCALAIRFSVEYLDSDMGITSDGEGREVIERLANLPDLWDVNIGGGSIDTRTSRFAAEAAQEPYVSFVKQVTRKPVVGVGRFTSPDTMVSQIKRGVLDFIGAARPSIADPFLPRKIDEGREDDIRECIGCNVCAMRDGISSPLICTQNPTMGEEWRHGWHPEVIPSAPAEQSVLVVGAGPAGLEAARALGERGLRVVLAEATTELGGRVLAESSLPGLNEWRRVRDYQVHQIEKMSNVEVYRDSRLEVDHVLEFGFEHVCIATGSSWRRNGVGLFNPAGIAGWEDASVLAADQVMNGVAVPGPVVVYDDDNFYLGSAIAEKLRAQGSAVTLVVTADRVANLCEWTMEQPQIQARMIELGIDIVTAHRVSARVNGEAVLNCNYSGRELHLPCTSLVTVTSRDPDCALYDALSDNPGRLAAAGISTLERIGDCAAPGLIAYAVHAGHRYAREFGGNAMQPMRDRVVV